MEEENEFIDIKLEPYNNKMFWYMKKQMQIFMLLQRILEVKNLLVSTSFQPLNQKQMKYGLGIAKRRKRSSG